MTTWTAQAHLLAGALPEWGMAAAALNAAAWSARIMPEATRGLAGAAIALTDGRAGEALWARTEPCPDAAAFLAAAAELEVAVTDLLKHASGLAAGCREAHEAAARGHQSAPAAAGGDTAQAQAAAERMHEARLVIADCEAALEVTGDAGGRLDHARRCLMRVPADYAEAYETPAGLVRRGLKLPYSGDFLTSPAA